ncbi:uncharacterized protein LOC133311457 [Gastrolobium bilobum]|uniref:uncharacterized protein LOC133311457 n=1 Tax=Gastrolobium bilobum TaxID=150636 RepID=UPI002AAFDC6A|nr:uncharacterized protein LOC133311457 [Gastrolobium bilobum]
MPTLTFLAAKFCRGLSEEIVVPLAGAASRDFETLMQQCRDIVDVCLTSKAKRAKIAETKGTSSSISWKDMKFAGKGKGKQFAARQAPGQFTRTSSQQGVLLDLFPLLDVRDAKKSMQDVVLPKIVWHSDVNKEFQDLKVTSLFEDALLEIETMRVENELLEKNQDDCQVCPFSSSKGKLLVKAVSQTIVREIVMLHGMPESIISDRDPKFTSRSGEALQRAFGTQLLLEPYAEPADDRDTINLRLNAFRKHKPLYFDGALDPIAAARWLQALEKIFRVMQCTNPQKLMFATYMLEGDTHEWWMNTSQAYEVQGVRELRYVTM